MENNETEKLMDQLNTLIDQHGQGKGEKRVEENEVENVEENEVENVEENEVENVEENEVENVEENEVENVEENEVENVEENEVIEENEVVEAEDEINEVEMEIVDALDQKIDAGLELGAKILGSDQREEIDDESSSSSQGGEHESIDEEEELLLSTEGDQEQKSIQHPPELARGWKDWFTEHPNKAKQSYGEHLLDSWKFGLTSLATCVFFLIHGIFPFMFEFTGSDWVIKLARHLEKKRKLVGLDRKLD